MSGKITVNELSDTAIEKIGTDLTNTNNLIQQIYDVVCEIDNVIKSEAELKGDLINAMNALGIECNIDTELGELFSIISNLKLIVGGDAVASDVISGKTFTNAEGELITGTMVNQGSKTITPSASTQTLPAGYYKRITINGDSDLTAANIRSGKNIFGVTGTGYPN